jgi:hypothetical protein
VDVRSERPLCQWSKEQGDFTNAIKELRGSPCQKIFTFTFYKKKLTGKGFKTKNQSGFFPIFFVVFFARFSARGISIMPFTQKNGRGGLCRNLLPKEIKENPKSFLWEFQRFPAISRSPAWALFAKKVPRTFAISVTYLPTYLFFWVIFLRTCVFGCFSVRGKGSSKTPLKILLQKVHVENFSQNNRQKK